MSRIAIADNQQLRFDHDLVDHWKAKGHEVKYEMGWSEHLAQWADLYYINFWDNNVHAAYHWHDEHPEAKKPKYAVRAIDWEVWCGLVRDQRIVDWVDYAFCIAPHIERKLRAEVNWGDKLHLIPCGINMEKFTLKKEFGGHNVLIPCNEIDWILKNVAEGIKIFGQVAYDQPNVPWKLTIRGKWTQGNEYFRLYFNDLIDKLQIKDRVTIVDQEVPDYNEFLEQFDYCLVPSFKEAFSYVTGECAAKGIVPIINHWYGAEEMWPEAWLYTRHEEAVTRIETMSLLKKELSVRHLFRNWVQLNKSAVDMLSRFDEVLGT